MKISGIAKLTLLDYPGRTACTLFTAGCNMRCPFCHNTPLVLRPAEQEDINEDELLAFLKKRAGVLDGVCITGGEPTLQPGLDEFIMKIRALGYKIKLDTNGLRPDVLERLLGAGLLDYVAMDIKSSRERYAEACGIDDIDLAAIERSAALLMSGESFEHRFDYEFRTTVCRELHDAETISGIAKWLAGARAYFIQSYKDQDELVGGGHMTAFSEEELAGLLAAAREYIPAARLRGVDM